MKRVLMVAYHFPPLAGSSGIQRTLRLARDLPELGWEPLVLSVDHRAYEKTSVDLMAEVPQDLVVRRALALDAARHLSIAGRYLGWTARPDRWVNWCFDGIRVGMQMIREFRPEVIWTTYPIATAHLIGCGLQRRSAKPWVADFRDPMAHQGYPADTAVWQSFKQVEEKVARHASRCVYTAPGAAQMYRGRYPEIAGRIVVVENGFDETSFRHAEAGASGAMSSPLNPGRVTLLHSGVVYPIERDPTQFFNALRQLIDRQAIDPERLRIRFRAAGHDEFIRRCAKSFGVLGLLEFFPSLPYVEALIEMQRADGLLVMQDRGCNAQIPAKIYEYLRAGRPIIALADPEGDTAGLLRDFGIDMFAALESVTAIAALLPRFLGALDSRSVQLADPSRVVLASRRYRSVEMAAVLDAALADPRGA